MSDNKTLSVPDLGDFDDVEIIEVLVSEGDALAQEDPVVTLETDKATMDIPATEAGTVSKLLVSVGDRISKGDAVLEYTAAGAAAGGKESESKSSEQAANTAAPDKPAPATEQSAPSAAPTPAGNATHTADVVVLGAGPGGYTAAFRAADLGLNVTLVERWDTLGGVCLNVGCIPSKALLHAAKVIDDAAAMSAHGIQFGNPRIDALQLRDWKNNVVGKLTGGLSQLAKQRKVNVVHGTAKFMSANRLALESGETIDFKHCIIAAGSEAAMIPGLPDDERIVDSSGALELAPLPKRMLVVGGGIIGLEMACVYSALGTRVSIVELTDTLMPGTDQDLVRPFRKIVDKRYEAIMLGTKVTGMRTTNPGIEVSFEGKNAPDSSIYDRVLVAVGRRANGDKIGADKAGVNVDDRGIIHVDKQMRTNVPHIFAIGDLAGGPMLAHKATHEAKVAAEVIAGHKVAFDARTIPSVAYTDPEIAWCGLTETDAKKDGTKYEKIQIPWAASGRALANDRSEGFTKVLFDKSTGRVLGGAIVGPYAGDLISELCLAVEMGADATDISLTIHPHPTLSETIAFAAEGFDGSLTDLYMPKKKR
ncbi:MAG: dihydrolipoyl dehydrogenase [Woeseia sp.]|nr:dihydrolipoyl dehydrogenase [Woeseia sp.]NNE61319.1 dihydrolipoyl dehydrogenase [Woeseia sp.]